MAGDRPNIDDVPPISRNHAGKYQAARVQYSGQIYGNQCLDVFVRCLTERTGPVVSRIVDKDIDGQLGKSAACAASASATLVSGANSLGLSKTGHPASQAGTILVAMRYSG